jgi:hypothetical protein
MAEKVIDPEMQKHARDFADERGEPVRAADWRQDGLWIIILAHGQGNFCGYIGIPIDHPLAGYDYDDLPIRVHGGLTFSGAGDGKYRPEGYYWYGWDYEHYGDFSYYYPESSGISREPREGEQDWTIGEVKSDAWLAIYDMTKLKKLAESIYSKTKEEK